jgi:acyl-CoA synthetase (AMP-forming)/AMP-acid ligase II
VLTRGGAAVLLAEPVFRAGELLDTIQRHRVNSVGWVGDAFARPVLAELDAHPDRWDLSSWSVLTSGGVLFSDDVKQGLLRHLPGLLIADVYGSSEAIAAARSVSRSGATGPPARSFTGGGLIVLAEDDSPVVPGSGQIGRVAYAGRLPVGYYKDEAKSAATFRIVRGRRYVITGDFATVEADGQVIVLGRGSSCINTGGEKVYPEEVEEVLKRHPSVADAAVLGLPDERFGETVAAAVQLAGGWDLDDETLRAHVRASLAGYKVPRQVVAVPEVTRGPNGKVDIPRIRALLAQSATLA